MLTSVDLLLSLCLTFLYKQNLCNEWKRDGNFEVLYFGRLDFRLDAPLVVFDMQCRGVVMPHPSLNIEGDMVWVDMSQGKDMIIRSCKEAFEDYSPAFLYPWAFNQETGVIWAGVRNDMTTCYELQTKLGKCDDALPPTSPSILTLHPQPTSPLSGSTS